MCSISTLRGRHGGIGDDLGQRLAVNCLRTRVDDSDAGVALAEGKKQVANTLHIDFRRLRRVLGLVSCTGQGLETYQIEVRFRTCGHDSVENEDGIQRLRSFNERLDERRVANITLHALCIFRMRDTFGHFWLYEIGQDQLVPVIQKSLRKHGTNHTTCAGDDDVFAF